MELHPTKTFTAEFSHICKGNTLLRKRIKKQLLLLKQNPAHPSLRLHKVDAWWSVSIDKSIRMLIIIQASHVYLYHVGKHEDVY